MKIAVTGASGLIGSHLVAELRADGHDVVTLVRRKPRQPGEVFWDPAAGLLDPVQLHGVEAAVHLAGAGIGDRRWTDKYKATVLSSRVESTRLFATTLAMLEPLPTLLLSASAIGFYGDTGDRIVDETSPAGTGFLATVCQAWEHAGEAAVRAGIRVCQLRSGIVLSAAGGALRKQLRLYQAGLGGPLGSGRQYQSWVSMADELGAIRFLLDVPDVHGPVNLVSPNPTRQQQFAVALGRAVHRPALLRTPGFAIRLALGAFADEGVLAGQRVAPTVLQRLGYRFVHPSLDAALTAALQHPAS